MKVAAIASPEPRLMADPGADIADRLRLADFIELTKPRIGVMVLFTVAVGYLLGAAPSPDGAVLAHTLFGTALVAAGSSAFNQWLERRRDARMARTADRPVPSGRVQPTEALAFGISLGVTGVAYLLFALPTPYAALTAAFTYLLYVAVYTPLKPVTPLNTLVGAVPGALPPVIGWLAARDALTAEAVSLFLILFVWQLPHFFAIAWMYRTDYAAGGMRMLPAVDPTGRLTSWSMTGTCVLLVGVGALPYFFGVAGVTFLVGAVLLGVYFLAACVRFARERTDRRARQVLRASLVYLAGLMTLLIATGLVPLYAGN